MSTNLDDVGRVTVPKVNRMAMASALLAALSVPTTWMAGIAVPAVLAIVAGHVALVQAGRRRERGVALAGVALTVSYVVVAVVVLQTLR